MTAVPGVGAAIGGRIVRANPAYRLVPSASLPSGARRQLERGGVELAAVAGVLVADPGAPLPDKLVDRAGAELFAALGRPGPVPGWAADQFARLLFDGVLEVECERGFVSGPLAWEVVTAEGLPAAPAPSDRLGTLSHDAVRYAERLRMADVEQTTARLYCFHRVPLARRWWLAFPGPGAVLEHLASPSLRRWDARSAHQPTDWLAWERRGAGPPTTGQLGYKLYVSPTVDALTDVLPRLVDAITESGAPRFKVGPDAAGLLRPDKVIVYLDDAAELDRAVRSLASSLDGVAPHGVPFTAQLAGDGLLSWGIDPGPDAGPAGGARESWRFSVARRLAEHLHAARAAPLRRSRPSDLALCRLALDGVDVATFAPAGCDVPPRVPSAGGRP